MAREPTDRDRQLAAAALQKQTTGGKPNKQEQRALDRVRAHAEEAKRWEHYRTCPKKHLAEMTGRQQKVLNEWAGRYNMPIAGPTVDLVALLAWLAQFLVDNSARLNAADETGVDSPALERFRAEQAEMARIKRLAMEKTLAPREWIRQQLARIASLLRAAGAQLEKNHGPDARAILDEALDDADREILALAAVDAADADQPDDV